MLPGALLSVSSKNKKNPLLKFIIFSQKFFFLIYWEIELFKKTSYILSGNLPSLKK